jgi:2-aminobenzoate-CoA ligase
MAITDCFPRYVGKIIPDDVISGTPPLAFTFGLSGVTLFSMRFGASTRFFPGTGPNLDVNESGSQCHQLGKE